jgi:hypothetical protein
VQEDGMIQSSPRNDQCDIWISGCVSLALKPEEGIRTPEADPMLQTLVAPYSAVLNRKIFEILGHPSMQMDSNIPGLLSAAGRSSSGMRTFHDDFEAAHPHIVEVLKAPDPRIRSLGATELAELAEQREASTNIDLGVPLTPHSCIPRGYQGSTPASRGAVKKL